MSKRFFIKGGIILTAAFLLVLGVLTTTTNAAGPARWINRSTILLDGKYFVDTNTADTTLQYTNDDSANCTATIRFESNANVNKFFYKYVDRSGKAKYNPCGVNKSGNPVATAESDITVTDVNNRRIGFIQWSATEIISLRDSGIVFKRDARNARLFVRQDGVDKGCADVIFKTAATSDDSGGFSDSWDEGIWTNNQVIDGSSVLYAVQASGGRQAESLADVYPAAGKDCGVDEEELTSTFSIEAQGANAEDLIAKGVNGDGSAYRSGDKRDDAFVAFVGTRDNLAKDASGAPVKPKDSGTRSASTAAGDDNSCKGGALGWILCPVAELIESATNMLFTKVFQPLLEVRPLSTIANQGLYQAWDAVRNIANVAFIIAFFAIIFSQATSVGLSNYGIKRLLPRLIAVAIGVNLSFYLCAFMVDVFNLLGAGIGNILGASFSSINQRFTSGGFAAVLSGGILTAIGVMVASGGTLLGPLFSVLIIGFFAFMAALLTLVLRQALIIILVIISPLALVAWLLPNTEKYFDKWKDMFIKLLFMYPLMAALFSVAGILGSVMSNVQQGSGLDPFFQAVSLLAYAAPLFVLPFTFKFAGGMMGQMYGAIRGRAEKISKPMGEAAQKKMALRSQERRYQMGNALSRYNRFGSRVTGAASRGLMGISGNAAESRKRSLESARTQRQAELLEGDERLRTAYAGRVGGPEGRAAVLASAQAALNKQEQEELQNAATSLAFTMRQGQVSSKAISSALNARLTGGLKGTESEEVKRAFTNIVGNLPAGSKSFEAALDMAAAEGEVATIENARTSDVMRNAQEMVDRVITRNAGTLKGKGGYHLATNFDLAVGRMDPSIDNSPAAREAAMLEQRILTFAQSGANSIAGAKAGLLGNTAEVLSTDGPMKDRLIAKLKEGDGRNMTALKASLERIVDNPNVLASTEAPSAIESMLEQLKRADPTPTPPEPPQPTPPNS